MITGKSHENSSSKKEGFFFASNLVNEPNPFQQIIGMEVPNDGGPLSAKEQKSTTRTPIQKKIVLTTKNNQESKLKNEKSRKSSAFSKSIDRISIYKSEDGSKGLHDGLKIVKNTTANLPEKIKMKYWVNDPRVVTDTQRKSQTKIVTLGEEINKQIEKYVSPFAMETTESTKGYRLKLYNVEETMAKKKISDIRKRYGGLITSAAGKGEPEDLSPTLAKSRAGLSMSIHGRPLTAETSYRSFGKNFRPNMRKDYQKVNFDEVLEVKKRLASKNIVTSTDVLTKALIIPDGLEPNVIDSLSLPLGPRMSTNYYDYWKRIGEIIDYKDGKKQKEKKSKK